MDNYIDIHVIYSQNRVRSFVYVVPHVFIMKYHTMNLTRGLTKLELKHIATFQFLRAQIRCSLKNQEVVFFFKYFMLKNESFLSERNQSKII